jgi:hypothetical protein
LFGLQSKRSAGAPEAAPAILVELLKTAWQILPGFFMEQIKAGLHAGE